MAVSLKENKYSLFGFVSKYRPYKPKSPETNSFVFSISLAKNCLTSLLALAALFLANCLLLSFS